MHVNILQMDAIGGVFEASGNFARYFIVVSLC